MSKAEILAELPKLSAQDRADILTRLCQLEESDGPSLQEQALLRDEQADYDANPDAGAPWSEVEARLLNTKLLRE